MTRERVSGEVLSVNRRGAVTVRYGDKLAFVSVDDAARVGDLRPGAQLTFAVDVTGVVPRATYPALAGEDA